MKPPETQLRSKVFFIRKKCSYVHLSTFMVSGVDTEATAWFDDTYFITKSRNNNSSNIG